MIRANDFLEDVRQEKERTITGITYDTDLDQIQESINIKELIPRLNQP